LSVVEQIAKERSVTPSQIACAWILQAPGVTAPIIGATKIAHLKEAIAAVDVKLTTDEVAALEKPYRPHPILGHEQPKPSRMVGAR
jgi:1-deoxyxylulose-5-phosphate synthase